MSIFCVMLVTIYYYFGNTNYTNEKSAIAILEGLKDSGKDE